MIWFADNEKVLCLCAITDRMKESSAAAISRLKSMGIKVVMLTGDADAPARYMAGLSGVDEYKAEVTPQQKAEFIRTLRSQGRVVAMAGDGINDSAATLSYKRFPSQSDDSQCCHGDEQCKCGHQQSEA